MEINQLTWLVWLIDRLGWLNGLVLRLGWLDWALLSIACWRMCHLIAKDLGPWNMLDAFRKSVPLGGLTTCIYCLSIWFSFWLLVVHVAITPWLTWGLAIAGGALMLRSFTGVGMHD